MKELDQLKLLSESIARIEEGEVVQFPKRTPPQYNIWVQIDPAQAEYWKTVPDITVEYDEDLDETEGVVSRLHQPIIDGLKNGNLKIDLELTDPASVKAMTAAGIDTVNDVNMGEVNLTDNWNTDKQW